MRISVTLLFVLVCMGKKGSASSASSSKGKPDDRAVVLKSIVKHGTRSGLTSVLVRLRDAGWLKEEHESSFENESTVKRDLQHAQEEHSKAQTIYGTVMQSMFLCATIPVWEYCNPVCMLRYLSCISAPFA